MEKKYILKTDKIQYTDGTSQGTHIGYSPDIPFQSPFASRKGCSTPPQ